MWMALKDKFGGTSATKFWKLTIKFDTYKKCPNHTMTQHLREMSDMVRELKSAGHTLTDEQQVQAMITSLPNSWEHMKIHMTHNENINTFDDIARHLKLEEERLEATGVSSEAYTTASGYCKGSSSKRKRENFKGKGKGKAYSSGHFNKKNKIWGHK